MSLADALVELAGYERRETIVDYQGWKWCISTSGKRAVPYYGPRDEAGAYTWQAARQAGMEVDIEQPVEHYLDIATGPQFREIHCYLRSRSPTMAPTDTVMALP